MNACFEFHDAGGDFDTALNLKNFVSIEIYLYGAQIANFEKLEMRVMQPTVRV